MEGLGLQRAGRWDLRGVGFALAPGEAWAVAGASGAGKTTLLALVLGLVTPTEGRILLEGEPWSPLSERDRRSRRPLVQAVLQDARASLPPHRTGWEILEEPLVVWGRGTLASRREAAAQMAARVHLPEAALAERPEAWSGGLAQRLCLGRALMLAPRLLVLDEPFSALDGPLAGALRDLLAGEQARGTALLLATHDLPAAADLCGHLLVLEEGQSVAQGSFQALVADGPPAVRRLWEASPRLPLA